MRDIQKLMIDGEMANVDCDAAIARFLSDTHHLHDSCVTSVEFVDGRFVDRHGNMHCGLGDQATLTMRLDSQGKGARVRYVLAFEGVSRFDYAHSSADDGLITSCTLSIEAGIVRLECNEWLSNPSPLVHSRTFKYWIIPND